MALNDLIQSFEDAKQKLEPIIKDGKLALPIFQVDGEESEHIVGDGFFYTSPNKLSWRFIMSGYDTDATPEKLLEAYREYMGKNITMEQALTYAAKRLTEWYEQLKELK